LNLKAASAKLAGAQEWVERPVTRIVALWRACMAERRRGSPLLERLVTELPEVFEVEVLKHLVGPRAWLTLPPRHLHAFEPSFIECNYVL